MNCAPLKPALPAIQMEDVAVGSLRDPARVVAEGIDWTVASGDCWIVAGLEGAGKTDFLMMTGGLMGPLRGRYTFLGESMPIFEGARLQHRLRLGLVFDGGQMLNHLTIRENVALPLCYHRNQSQADAYAEARRMLEWLELTEWAESTPGAVGRNWLKRAGLARALMLRPEVLLLDEPLAGPDLRHRQWWLDFLHRLASGHPLYEGRPVTLVVTSSDLRPWSGWDCNVAVLKDKRFALAGTSRHIRPGAEDLVADLMARTAGAG